MELSEVEFDFENPDGLVPTALTPVRERDLKESRPSSKHKNPTPVPDLPAPPPDAFLSNVLHKIMSGDAQSVDADAREIGDDLRLAARNYSFFGAYSIRHIRFWFWSCTCG